MKFFILLFCSLLINTFINAQDFDNNFKKNVEQLASKEFNGRYPQTKGDTLAANYIRKQFENIEGVEFITKDGFQHFSFTERGSKPKKTLHTFNVISFIEANNKKNSNDEYIIIGAHYDHMGSNDKGEIFYGADDNASGVSYVIELARRLASQKEELKYNVLFVIFGAEEHGLKGSTYYAENPLIPFDKCRAMINFDMVGRMTNKGITIRGLGGSKEGVEILNAIPNKDKLDIVWEFRGAGPTDYAPFYLKGVPAFSFSTRIHKDYHTSKDTPDKVNYKGVKLVDNYVSLFLNELLNPKVKLTYKDVYQ